MVLADHPEELLNDLDLSWPLDQQHFFESKLLVARKAQLAKKLCKSRGSFKQTNLAIAVAMP
jgi:hypothetical protein